MEQKEASSQKHFSIIYHIINPIIASLITYFFLWVLKDFLLLNFIFTSLNLTIIGFLVLVIAMIIISWYLPYNFKT